MNNRHQFITLSKKNQFSRVQPFLKYKNKPANHLSQSSNIQHVQNAIEMHHSERDLLSLIEKEETLIDFLENQKKQAQQKMIKKKSETDDDDDNDSQAQLIDKEEQDIKKAKEKVFKNQRRTRRFNSQWNQRPVNQSYLQFSILPPTKVKKYNFHQTFENINKASNSIISSAENLEKVETKKKEQVQIDQIMEMINKQINKSTTNYYNYDDSELFQDHKRMGKIIQRALLKSYNKEKPQNASLSVFQKRTNMQIYLDKEYQNQLKRKSRNIKFQLQSNKVIGDEKQRLKSKLNKYSQNNMLNVFKENQIKKNNGFIKKNNDIYMKCHEYLTEQ